MRTILLAPALFSSEGGIERMMRLYLKAVTELAGPADQVTLASLNDPTVPPDRLAAYSAKPLHRIICGARRRWRFTARVLWESLSADRIIAGHFHLLPILSLAKRLRPGLEVFVVAHGTEVWRSWSSSEQRTARSGVRFLAVSDYTRSRILSRCPGLPAENVRVVPNALDHTLAMKPPVEVPRQPGLLLTVSRLSAADSYKGVDHLIQALPLIRARRPGTHLRIVGQGDDRERLEELARQHAPGAVTFTGFLPDAEMPTEYAQASLFALPSRDEGFGLVYLEAFTQGTPCVAASAGAAPELITHETGRCAIYGDIENLAMVCIDALNTKWSQETIIERTKAFSFDAFCQKLTASIQA